MSKITHVNQIISTGKIDSKYSADIAVDQYQGEFCHVRKDMQRLIDINFNRLPLSSPNFITGGDASIDASTSKRALIRFLQQLSTITGAASTLNIAEKLTEVVKIVENVENDILHSKS